MDNLFQGHKILFMRIRNLFFALLLFSIAACSTQPFAYDKKKACIIDYGLNGISVIVDKDNILVRNNRQLGFGDPIVVRTGYHSYSTRSRYFDTRQAQNLIEDMKISSPNSLL